MAPGQLGQPARVAVVTEIRDVHRVAHAADAAGPV
jgi:hypothetical protein